MKSKWLPSAFHTATPLSRAIFALVIAHLVAGTSDNELNLLLILACAVLGAWSAVVILRRVRERAPGTPFYDAIAPEDSYRVFFVLLCWSSRAMHSGPLVFWAFSVLAAITAHVLLTSLVAEVARHGAVTQRLVGLAFFLFFLASWERTLIARHHGAAVIGHFFERPTYRARYYLRLGPENATSRYRVPAEIEVSWHSTHEASPAFNFLGDATTILRSRAVRVRRIFIPGGGTFTVGEQAQPIEEPGDSSTVYAPDGRALRVTLLDEPAT